MPASTNPICGILPNVISGKRIPELDDDMLADEDDAAAVEIERAAASVKQSRMRHEIKMVPVAGEGEELRPLLSDLIPEVSASAVRTARHPSSSSRVLRWRLVRIWRRIEIPGSAWWNARSSEGIELTASSLRWRVSCAPRTRVSSRSQH
jgi:hypothetical protein